MLFTSKWWALPRMAFFKMHLHPCKNTQLKASYKSVKKKRKRNWQNQINIRQRLMKPSIKSTFFIVATEFLWTGYVMSAPFDSGATLGTVKSQNSLQYVLHKKNRRQAGIVNPLCTPAVCSGGGRPPRAVRLQQGVNTFKYHKKHF